MSVHGSVPRMPEEEAFRTFLGPLAEAYNEVQLRQLRAEMHAMAELLLDLYLAKKKGPASAAFDRTGPEQ